MDPAAALRDFRLEDEDLRAWKSSGLPESAFEGWLTDRVARRPTGPRARAVYGADDVHDFARREILAALALEPSDRVLDIGCGGGLLLRDILATGASATGLDHSAEMVALARERAPDAEVVEGDAGALPFGDESFTAVTMCVVFFFLPDPVATLRECRRVLAPGGRIASYTAGPEMRGTIASPEPIASQGRFHTDEELVALAEEADFTNAAVAHENGGQLLTARR